MTRKAPFFFVILFAAVCFETFKIDYHTKNLIIALSLAMLFAGYVFYDFLYRKRRISSLHILLGIPIVTLLVLVAMEDIAGFSQVAIWGIFAGVAVLCVGLAP